MKKREPYYHLQRIVNFIILNLLFVWLLTGFSNCGEKWNIQNPYSDVDWKSYQQYKANFHTHTTMSDGSIDPATAIDHYVALDYDILAITDHDTRGEGNDPNCPERHKTVWPWQKFGRDPEALGIIAIEGNEISNTHHIVSLFNDYGDPEVESEEKVLHEIGKRGGLAFMAHPGLYRADNWARRLQERDELWRKETTPTAWYVNLLNSYEHLLGVEVFILGDRAKKEHHEIWDAILTEIDAERSVWGFSNDDMHGDKQLGYNWNIMLLPELSKEWVRRAMENGMFFFVYSPSGHEGPSPPLIRSIKVNSRKGTLHIDATGHERIDWISEGKIVHSGDGVNLFELDEPGKYIRAMVYAEDNGSVVGTQPFRLKPPSK